MMRLLLLLLCLLTSAGPLYGQVRSSDGVDLLLTNLERILNAHDEEAFGSLFSSLSDAEIDRHRRELFTAGAVRTVVRERDRALLEGVPEGEGHQLVVEVFAERSGTARILTSGFDVRRPPDGDLESWRIVRVEEVAAVEGLYRLRLNTATAFDGRNFEIGSEDLVLTLQDGTVFPVDSDDGVTGLVLVGRGQMRFSPRPETERGQVRIFGGSENLVADFDSAFVRLSPLDYRRRVATGRLTPVTPDQRVIRRAQQVFEREAPKSLNVELQDLSSETWFLLPPSNDFVAEVQTRRHDTLTYSMSSTQAEDISLFQRDRRRTIALYPSIAKLEARGRFYSDDALRDYDVLDYNIEASITPDREFIEGRVRLTLRVRAPMISTLMLRLADPLAVSGVTSVEYGRLLHLRIRNQNLILVNLPRMVPQDSDLTLVVTYAGRLPSQELEIDTLTVSQDPNQFPGDFASRIEPHYLLSSRSFWYPQNPVADYATATMRLTVPDGYAPIATGEALAATEAVTLRDLLTLPAGKSFVFRANQPLRYLAVIVSRFVRVAETVVSIDEEGGTGFESVRIQVAVEANPRQQSRGRAVVGPVEDILEFYSTLMGDAPYASLTVAVVESELPGGHSPGYFIVLNDPVPNPNITWRSDPASFDNFPEFFLAHELAHQWWGQAVGWKNYHEQWLSEGFSQYFAALYAQKARGDRVFNDMLRQFRRWGISQSDQGPVHLGYRLGHIRGDLRAYRAVVYNKGAAVLHMLRRVVGDDIFFDALRLFYQDRKYQKAGTDDLHRAFETASGRELDRFFERWIYGTSIPRVRYSTTVADGHVRARFQQVGDLVFDLPVTVTLVYTDGRTEDVVVVLSEQVTERVIPAAGAVRQVQINRDSAALAEFDQQR